MNIYDASDKIVGLRYGHQYADNHDDVPGTEFKESKHPPYKWKD